jgi:hypothetical protein
MSIPAQMLYLLELLEPMSRRFSHGCGLKVIERIVVGHVLSMPISDEIFRKFAITNAYKDSPSNGN